MVTPTTWSPTSFVANSGDAAIDSLLSNVKWGGLAGTGVSLTYSFPGFGSYWATSDYVPAFGGSGEPFDPAFAQFTVAQQTAARIALEQWSNVANISFTLTSDTANNVGDIRFGNTDEGFDEAAHAYWPGAFAKAGDVWINNHLANIDPTIYSPTLGTYQFTTLLHELGHALGLKHPHESNGSGIVLQAELDYSDVTIMSYNLAVGKSAGVYIQDYYATTPMLLDIIVIQHMYGANMSYHAGDDTYVFNQDQFYNQVIWDAGGNNTIQWSGHSPASIDLRELHFSKLGKPIEITNFTDTTVKSGTVAIALGTVIQNAIGGSGNDEIIGNDVGNVLRGNDGSDALSGLAGNDTFVYSSASYSFQGNNILVGLTGGLDAFDGGTGTDTADFSALNFVTGRGVLVMQSGSLYEAHIATGSLPIKIATLSGIENITGTPFGDTLHGTVDGNVLVGGGGDDTLNGGQGIDTLNGGDNNDTIVATHADGVDTITGGAGFDILDLSQVQGPVQVNQLAGTTTGSAGNDILTDVIEQIMGTNFDDVLSGGHGINVLDGGGGKDKFFGNNGDDLMRGGTGDDTFFFSNSDGNDRLQGGAGFDVLDYSSLNGVVQVNQLAGTTTGTANNDTLLDVFEMVIGTAFGDVLSGGHGINSLKGGGGDDQIFANNGDDYVTGGTGNDTIALGGGSDTFDMRNGDQRDTITDLVGGAGVVDRIDLRYYTGLGITTFTELQSSGRIVQVGANTEITLNAGDSVILQNFIASTLVVDDFWLV